MNKTKNSEIYLNAQLNLEAQKNNLIEATTKLEEFKASNFPMGAERQLRATQLAQTKYNEQNLYDEKLQELGDAALDLIEDLKANNTELNKRVRFDIESGRYFEVYLDKENSLVFLGPYSES